MNVLSLFCHMSFSEIRLAPRSSVAYKNRLAPTR